MKIYEIIDRQERFDSKRMRKVLKKQRGNKCEICNTPGDLPGSRHANGLEIHHIIPRSKGGTSTPDNAQVVCRPCHVNIHKNNPD